MKKLFLLAVAASLIVSCHKAQDPLFDGSMIPKRVDPSIQLISGEAQHVLVKHNWLHFASMEAFTSTMNTLHDGYPVERLSSWDRQFAGYTSLRASIELMEAGSDADHYGSSADSLINLGLLLDCPDSHFATVLSADGRIQIADTLYQFLPGQNNGEAFAIPERHIASVLQGEDLNKLSGVVVFLTSMVKAPFPRWEDGTSVLVDPSMHFGICNFPHQLMLNWWGQRGGDIYGDDNGFTLRKDNDRPVRLNYHRWRVNYRFYSSVGVRVKMWKHTRFGGWMSNVNFNSASIEACVKGFTVNHTLIHIPFSNQINPAITVHNTNSFERTLMWNADPLFADVYLQHFNFRFKVNYQGQVMERFIRE